MDKNTKRQIDVINQRIKELGAVYRMAAVKSGVPIVKFIFGLSYSILNQKMNIPNMTFASCSLYLNRLLTQLYLISLKRDSCF